MACEPTAASEAGFATSTKKWGGNGSVAQARARARKSVSRGRSADFSDLSDDGTSSEFPDLGAEAATAFAFDPTTIDQSMGAPAASERNLGVPNVSNMLKPAAPPAAPLNKPASTASKTAVLVGLAIIAIAVASRYLKR